MIYFQNGSHNCQNHDSKIQVDKWGCNHQNGHQYYVIPTIPPSLDAFYLRVSDTPTMHLCSNAEQALKLQHITAIHEQINTKVCESPSPEKLYEFFTRACASHTHTRADERAHAPFTPQRGIIPNIKWTNIKLVWQNAAYVPCKGKGHPMTCLFRHTAKLEVGGQYDAPAASPPKRTRYPLYRRLCEPRGRSGRHGTSQHTGIRHQHRAVRSQSQ